MLILNATLWDSTGAAPQHGAALLTRDDRIEAVGAQAGLSSRTAAGDEPVIDAQGRWLLPGLVDLHVHLTVDPAQPDTVRQMVLSPPPEQALLAARNARLMLEAGFTAARDLGGGGYANVALKHAIDRGWVPGPRLVTAGMVLTVVGGHFDPLLPPEVSEPAPNVISGAEQARRAVREQAKRGADWIKLLASGGVMTAGTSLGAALWEDDELRAAVAMARRLGKPVAAHCHGAAAMIAAAEAGVTTIEHGTMGDAAAAEAMSRHHVTLVPTFVAAAGVVREAKAGRLPRAIAQQALQIAPTHRAAFRAALAAGVQVACGTDTGVPGTAFGENARELALLVDHGLTPEQALLAATRDAAHVLGWAAHAGTLEPGKYADFLLLDGDPLADVAVLGDPQRLHLVVKGGAIAADRRPES